MTLKKSAEKVDFWTELYFYTYIIENQPHNNSKHTVHFSVHFFILRPIVHLPPFLSPVFQSSFKKWTESGLKSGLPSNPYTQRLYWLFSPKVHFFCKKSIGHFRNNLWISQKEPTCKEKRKALASRGKHLHLSHYKLFSEGCILST